MKKQFIYLLAVSVALLVAGCQKDNGNSGKNGGKNGYFGFETTKTGNISVKYRLKGYDTGILFEVYAENPWDTDNNVRRTDIKPVFRAVTDKDGSFDGLIHMPTCLSTVFVATDFYVANDVVEVPVVNGSVDFDADNNYGAPRSAVSRATTYQIPSGFYTFSGETDWDATGLPTYLEESETVPDGLLTDIRKILKSGKSLLERRPDLVYDGADANKYKNHNINLKDACEVDFVYVTSAAAWYNAMAYYTYPTNAKPASPSEIERRTIVFPCMSGSGHPLKSGDKVKLKYWNGSEYVDKFPAGTSIGFVMLPAYFSKGDLRANNYGGQASIIYSDASYNLYGKAADQDRRQQSVALYNQGRDLVVIGFEDRTRGVVSVYNDHDFDDAIFYCNVSPWSAIDVPDDGHKPDDLDPENPVNDPEELDYYIEYEGLLAFEDLWPHKGDYDMNDVGLKYYSKVYYHSDNKIYKSEDSFTPVCKGGLYTNGFGFQYGVASGKVTGCAVAATNGAPAHSFYPVISSTLEPDMAKATVMLFDDANEQIDNNGTDGKDKSKQVSLYSYTVTTTYDNIEVEELGFPPYNPFIVVQPTASEDQRSREVHLTNYAPTEKCTDPDNVWFGKQDDKSDKVNYWYVSSQRFPFAINIPAATWAFPDENQRIDAAYPRFSTWVSSFGAQDTDWWQDVKR